MADKIYIVEGRQFRSESEHKLALRDLELIEKLKKITENADLQKLKAVSADIEKGKYHFGTILGQDFVDELDDRIRPLERQSGSNKNSGKNNYQSSRDKRNTGKSRKKGAESNTVRYKASSGDDRRNQVSDAEIEAQARRILKHKEKKRSAFLIACSAVALISLGVFVYFVISGNVSSNKAFYLLKEKAEAEKNSSSSADNSSGNVHRTDSSDTDDGVTINYTQETPTPDVLPEYADMLSANSKFIGWLSIDGTDIDYPVAQTSDNEYYLTHDLEQNYDRNGTIFLDCNCDIIKPSTNLILYGHHMRSGKMFGKLGLYEDESYFENHQYISFNTIYEYGTYQVMYVFRSHVYEESEIAFKYYQFYDAYSEVEFDSYMNEMAEMSLYDTGVTAQYGDRLLTLSTCDYEEANGRFVVVAKKIN